MKTPQTSQSTSSPPRVKDKLAATGVSADPPAPNLPSLIADPNTGAFYAPGPVIGRGGFAWCYQFVCTRTRREFAAKIIPKSRLTKSTHREKVLREINIHETLRHRHVVRLYSAFETNDNIIIVLEYCRNQSLVQILRQKGRLSEAEVKYFFAQLLEGLAYLHDDCHVLHRDVKLGNILITEDLQVKIADFGFAVKLHRDNTGIVGTQQNICGTPNYLSPELLRSEGSSYASDAWAAGCVLFALFSGKPPFETSSLQDTYARIKCNSYTIPSFVGVEAADLITRLLSPDPKLRPTVSECLRHPFLREEVSCDSGYLTPDYLYSVVKPLLPPSSKDRSPDWSGDFYTRNDNRRKSYLPDDRTKKVSTSSSGGNVSPLKTAGNFTKITVRTVKSVGSIEPVRAVMSREKSFAQVGVSTTESSPSSTSFGVWPYIEDSSRNGNSSDSPAARSFNVFPETAQFLYASLHKSMSLIPDGSSIVRVVVNPVLFCTRWIDYTNRYGFATQFSDGSLSVWFNDGCRICLSADSRVYRYLKDSQSEWLEFARTVDMPDCVRLRASLLHHFCKYMEDNLISGAKETSAKKVGTGNCHHIHKWCRRDGCIAMLISNGSYQINFNEEHVKLIMCPAAASRSGKFPFTLTLIDSARHSESFPLSSVPQLCYERPQLGRFLNTALLLLDQLLLN